MTPVERLTLSRQRLRAAMLPPPGEPHRHPLGDKIGAFVTDLIERFKGVPSLAGLIEYIEGWWAQHPLRAAGLIVAEASRKLTTPMAERHPLGLIFAAALVGALLVFSRPWRWIVSPALFAGLLPSLASRTIRELPVDSWAKVLASISAPRASQTQPPTLNPEGVR